MYPKAGGGDDYGKKHPSASSVPSCPPGYGIAPPTYYNAQISSMNQHPGSQPPQGSHYGGIYHPNAPSHMPFHSGQPAGPPPSYVGGPQYPTGYCPPPAYQNPIHVTHHVASFDAGARFGGNGGGSMSVPPPPPGYAPTAAQAAAMQGNVVLMEKKRTKFW